MTKVRLATVALFVLTVIPIVVVNYYPAGDWVSGPLLILYLLVPLLIMQFVLMLFCFGARQKAKRLAMMQAAIMFLANA